MRSRHAPILLVAVAYVAAVASYWTGLNGPFVLDDDPNFGAVRAWVSGQGDFHQILFPPRAWIDHRSVSMVSFALTAKLGGYDPFAFKLGNLLLHLACGGMVYAVLSRLLPRDPQLGGSARMVAAMVTAVWLLHPLHASTVLYAVQRMTQLGALFCLAGLWVYVKARNRIESCGGRRPAIALFLLFPLTLLLAIQSKPNAAVLPLLLFIVEAIYYGNSGPRPTVIKAFHLVFLGLPLAIGGIGLAIDPQPLLGRYAEYDFSASERLLTQPRVLCDYLLQLLAPKPPSMGVFTDGYVVSRGLLAPPSTAIALAALVGVSFVAWRCRHQARGFFFGWCFFIGAHAIESFVAPVELYYEHRNYLPSVGIFVAVASLLCVAGRFLKSKNVRARRVGLVALSALLLLLAIQTHGRARVWSDPLVLIRSEVDAHPRSVRALVNYAGVAQTVGDLERAYAVVNEAAGAPADSRLKAHALLLRAWLDCYHRDSATEQDVREAIGMTGHLDLLTYLSLESLAAAVEQGACGRLDRTRLAPLLAQAADQARHQPDDLNLKWAIRNRAAQFYADVRDWESALEQARLGWQKTTPGEGAAMLVEIFLVTGHPLEAQRVLDEALARIDEPAKRKNLKGVQTFIDAELRSPGWNRRRVNDAQSGG